MSYFFALVIAYDITATTTAAAVTAAAATTAEYWCAPLLNECKALTFKTQVQYNNSLLILKQENRLCTLDQNYSRSLSLSLCVSECLCVCVSLSHTLSVH